MNHIEIYNTRAEGNTRNILPKIYAIQHAVASLDLSLLQQGRVLAVYDFAVTHFAFACHATAKCLWGHAEWVKTL